MVNMSRRTVLASALAAVPLVGSTGSGCAAFPDKSITLVVPYPPGGTTDLLGRLAADRLRLGLGATVAVENIVGAGTLLGAAHVARSLPDGYTLLMATSTTLAINRALYKKLPYDPIADFTPIALIAGVPFALVINPAIPVTSLQISYWMAGAYLMAIKRYAEIRDVRTRETLVQYRRVFRRLTERNLMASIAFYGSLSMLFFGAFMGRYRLEMALAFPLVAGVMATYMALAFKPDSAAQRPEGLWREPWLLAAVAVCALAIGVLLFADLPWLHELFKPTSASPGSRL